MLNNYTTSYYNMKLLTVAVVFGFVALAVSKTHFSQYGSGPYQDADHVQGHAYDRYGQHSSNYGLSPSQDYEKYSGYNQPGQNAGEYSESNWNVQSRYQPNKFGQNKQGRQYSQEYTSEDYSPSRRSQFGGSFNQQTSEERYQQFSKNKKHMSRNYGSFYDFNDSESSSSSESDSQEDYIKDEITSDISMEIGRKVAQKMVKFFTIFDKYAARDGTVQTNQAQDPFALRQWTFPMAHHEYLNMNDSKLTGLSQGYINTMYVNTEQDSVDLEYFFNNLMAKGYMKSSTGPKGPFNLMMTNTCVNVSTELENQNRNRNYAHSHSENIEINYPNSGGSSDIQMINDNIEHKYVQFMNKAIESEMIDYTYGGLVGCLRSEIESAFSMPSNSKLSLVIENKKTQLTVSLTRTQSWNDDQVSKQRKIQSVAFRQNKSGKGYKLKVKVILAKQPTWESDVYAKKSHQEINVKNVNFHAKNIIATAVMERMQQQGGAYKFNVEDASIKLEGLKFDIGKFNFNNAPNEKLAREVGQNLPKILENGMSAALQQQLYQQQQICQQSPMDCVRCN